MYNLARFRMISWYFVTCRAIRWAWLLMYKLWGPAPQKFVRAKKSKIRLDFGHLSTLTANTLETNRNIKNWKQIWSTSIPAGFSKKLVDFGPLTKKLQAPMLIYRKSKMRISRMLMRWSSSHVTVLWGEFQPPKFFPQLYLGRRTDSR